MQANKELQDLYRQYLTLTGVHQGDTAGYLTLAHVLLELKKAIDDIQLKATVILEDGVEQ